MRYFDYDWKLYSDKIVLDPELNTDGLGWKNGDFFRFENHNGQQVLVKTDPIVPFINGIKQNTP